MMPPCWLIKVRTLPCGSVKVRSMGFKKILRLVGKLGSWCRLVGRLRWGVRVSASFQKILCLVGQLGSWPHFVGSLTSEPCLVGRLGSGVWVSFQIFCSGGNLRGEHVQWVIWWIHCNDNKHWKKHRNKKHRKTIYRQLSLMWGN